MHGPFNMATLTIRKLDEALKAKLRLEAAKHGRSMEEEARIILRNALCQAEPARGLGSRIRERYAALGGVELELPSREEPPRGADFDQ